MSWLTEKCSMMSSLSLSWRSFELFLFILHWSPGRRVQHLPLYFPSLDCCRQQWGCPSGSFLQTKQDQRSQVLHIRHSFQHLHHLFCSPLDAFMDFHILLKSWDPERSGIRLSLSEQCVCPGSWESKPHPGLHQTQQDQPVTRSSCCI